MLKDKLRQFMTGRYGNDELSMCILVVGGVCLLFAAISRNKHAAAFFVFILILLVVWSIFRMLSRNTDARSRENEIYKTLTGGFKRSSRPFKESMSEWWKNIKSIKPKESRKTYGLKYCLFKCPGCGVDVRIPANKGKIMVKCPKCKTEFERVS